MLIVCSVLVFSLKTTKKKTGYYVQNVSDWRTHFVLVWWKILFVSIVRYKYCLVLILYYLYLVFFFFFFFFCIL
jgi:hypothetical protein